MKSQLHFATNVSNRPDTPYDTDWQINLSQFTNPKFNMKLLDVTGYNVVPNITSKNNELEVRFARIYQNIRETTIIIEPNQYNGDTLAAAIKTAIDAIAADILAVDGINIFPENITVTIDEVTGKTILTGELTNGYVEILSGGSLNKYLGFVENGEIKEQVQDIVITSDYPVNLQGTTFIDLNFNFSSANIAPGLAGGHLFARVPIDVNFGEQFTFRPFISNGEDIQVQLDNIYMTMTDEDGDLWPYPPTHNFSVSLELITYKDDTDAVHSNPF